MIIIIICIECGMAISLYIEKESLFEPFSTFYFAFIPEFIIIINPRYQMHLIIQETFLLRISDATYLISLQGPFVSDTSQNILNQHLLIHSFPFIVILAFFCSYFLLPVFYLKIPCILRTTSESWTQKHSRT